MTADKIGLTFVPHLLPMIRGIHTTLYGRLTRDPGSLQALFESTYANEPFVDVMPAGSTPETRSVKGANTCRSRAVGHRQSGQGGCRAGNPEHESDVWPPGNGRPHPDRPVALRIAHVPT